MKTILHKSETRGHANHGWLNSFHTFSFARYHNSERMHFGALRVLNDDVVAPGQGFGTHPHENMEIISIPLEGDLEHKDSMGNTAVIRKGEIQVMSAGTGIYHSEYNKNQDREVKFLQIWVFPDKTGVEPRYDQQLLDQEKMSNSFAQVLSPDPEDDGVWIHQQAWFSMGRFEKGVTGTYHPKIKGNGIYLFVLEGEGSVQDTRLSSRDGLGILDTEELTISALEDLYVLLMEVPMDRNP